MGAHAEAPPNACVQFQCASTPQFASQPSPAALLPSSQPSLRVRTPSPHTCRTLLTASVSVSVGVAEALSATPALAPT